MFKTISHLSNEILFVIAYVAGLSAYIVMNRVEFKRCPEKGQRYKALPIGYKIICWFFVIPLFSGSIFEGGFFILGCVSFLLLEGACVRWYRKAGLM